LNDNVWDDSLAVGHSEEPEPAGAMRAETAALAAVKAAMMSLGGGLLFREGGSEIADTELFLLLTPSYAASNLERLSTEERECLVDTVLYSIE
jgi:hypothetical protein